MGSQLLRMILAPATHRSRKRRFAKRVVLKKRSDDSTSQDLLSSKPREKTTKDLTKLKSRIKLVPDLFCETAEAIIVSRAGKVGKQKGGKHQSWYNLEFLAPEALAGTTSIDFSRDVQHWEPTEERDGGKQMSVSNVDHVASFESAEHTGTDSDDFLNEKFVEIQSWKDNDVFDELPFNESMKPLGTRWVLTVKPDGIRKARLVAKGFQDREVDSLIKDSPTCSKETFRIAVAVFASNNRWNTAKALDVKTAFLQGVPLKRDVYISPPKDMFPNSNFTWKLKKCVYGLADASRYWYDRVLHEFEALGGRRSTFDYALFLWKNDGCICTYVEDFWILGTSEFVEKVELNLSRIFHIGTVLSVPFNYLGLKIEQWDDRVILDLANPLGDLAEIEIPRDRILDKTNSINEQERCSLRSALGKLLWPAMQTRPDILFTAASMASKIPHATIFDLLNTNKLIRKVKHENTVLKFPRFNNNVDGSTQGGYLVFVVDNNTMESALIAWQGRKVKRVARSTLMAETFACIEGIDCSLLCAKTLDI